MTCGVGGWGGPLPGDPSNDIVLAAIPAYGGIDLTWSFPSTNPYAVSYIKIYRSATNDSTSALKIAEVSGDRYFDPLPTVTTAYYWIQVISINGTVAALVGPASATSMLAIDDLLAKLSGKIDDGLLATILRTKVDKIPLIELDLADEITARLADNASLAALLASVETDVGGVAAAIVSETTTRITQNSALVSSLDAMAVSVSGNTAAILSEASTRATADSAMAYRLDVLEALGGGGGTDFAAAIEVERLARVAADEALASTLTALIASSITASETTLTAAIADEATARATADTAMASTVSALEAELTTLIGTEIGAAITTERAVRVSAEGALGTRIDTTQASITTLSGTLTGLISSETTARTTADSALASSITTVQTTLDADIASVRTDMTADIAVVDGKAVAIGARWTAVVDVNGMVGGFGVYNDGSTIEAGFNVDTFWVGRATDKIKPFIITDGTVYINEAAIGQLSANAIDTRGLLIRNGAGQVIFGAGATVDPSAFMSVPSGWLNTNAIATAAADATAKADAAQTAAATDATTKANAAQAAAIASSTTGLALKLNNSSASTLSAVLSLDAAAVSGLRIGNLTWNSAGARVSGYGVAITPFGLVGYNPAGDATFSLNAATGSLSLQGDISGSTGNFVGSVSVNGATWSNGATGFFAGMDSGFARLRIGSSLQYLSYDAETGKLDLKLDAITVTPSTVGLSYSAYSNSSFLTSASVAASGGTAPYTYSWSTFQYEANGGSLVRMTGATGRVAGFELHVGDGGSNASGRATCVVTDTNGRVGVANINLSAVSTA